MRELYLIGGYASKNKTWLKSNYNYNTESNKREKKASLKKARKYAACTDFEGKILVTGGLNEGHLRLAEACDYYENKLG